MRDLLLNRWVIMAIGLLVIFAALFGRDIYEQSTDAARGYLGTTDKPLDVLPYEVVGATVRAARTHNEPANLSVSDIKIETRSVGVSILSARLSNTVAGNDYPNVAVVLKGPDGKVQRTVEFTPSQYEHAAVLAAGEERIRFNLALNATEGRMSAHATYPAPSPRAGAPAPP